MRKSKFLSMALLIIGIISIILAVLCFGKYTGGYESNYSYGGDAYTGIQNAAAQAANNIQDASEILVFGFGSVLLVAGLTMSAIGISGFGKNSSLKVNNEEQLKNNTTEVQSSAVANHPVNEEQKVDEREESERKEQ